MPTSEPRAPRFRATTAPRLLRAAVCLISLAVAAAAAAPAPARAQRPDSTRADTTRRAPPDSAARANRPARRPARAPAVDTTPRPPISPRRAFLSSLAVPGLGQTKLGRPNAAAVFATVEAIALLMAGKSALDLRTARYGSSDSIVVGFQTNTATGAILTDTVNGVEVPRFTYERPNSLYERISARRTHYEDWVALLIFNHFFAGADAFVAAQLWDLPAQVGFRPAPGGLSLVATVRFR